MATETFVPTPEVFGTEPREATDLRRHTVTSNLLGGDRELVVFVPEGYDGDIGRRYPVLYMQDGQNLFDPTTSYVPGKDWRVDQTAHQLIREGRIQPLIIVGVNHAGEKRVEEYTPSRDSKRNGGQASTYLRALAEVVKPFIDSEYRTHTDAWNTGLAGSSLGGLFTLYAGLERPDIFSKLGVMSPSAWWNRRYIVRAVSRMVVKPRTSIWLDIGTAEGSDTVNDVRTLREALVDKGWIENDDLRYLEAEDAIHDEDAWSARAGPMLEFLFPLAM